MYGLKEDWEQPTEDREQVLDDYVGAVPRWCSGCGDHSVLGAVQRLARDEQRDAGRESAAPGQRLEIAGVVVEPILQGAAGMRLWAPELLARLRAATRAADTFLIADEVFTGYGRTGPMWACDHADIAPDLLCLAKGFSGGVLPFAATLATPRIFDGFRGGLGRALMHGHTFCGHPLGAAIAREVLAIYRDEDVLGQVRGSAPIIAAAFERMAAISGTSHPRALGMVGAIEVGPAGYYGDVGWRVFEAARRRGVYLRPIGNTVYVVPPLNIDRSDLDTLLAAVHESVAESLAGEPPSA